MKEIHILCMVLLASGLALTGRVAYMHAKAELAGVLIERPGTRACGQASRRRRGGERICIRWHECGFCD